MGDRKRADMEIFRRAAHTEYFDTLPLSLTDLCAVAAFLAPSYLKGTVAESAAYLTLQIRQGADGAARAEALNALGMQATYGPKGSPEYEESVRIIDAAKPAGDTR